MVGKLKHLLCIFSVVVTVAGCGAYQPQFKPFQKPTNTTSSQTTTASSEIRVIQQALKDNGYTPGPIDGIAGERTRKAIRKFQRDNGLPETSSMDKQTRKLLGL